MEALTRMRSLALALLLALVAGVTASPAPVAATGPTIEQLIGQKLVVAMDGTTPSASLLARIRAGEVGGVILFGSNITTATALTALTKQLHDAATAGGQPRLLVYVDQEGGSIKRIPWAPPTLSPPQMGALGSTSTATSQGKATGQALKALGIDVDLAPVVDVPFSTSSFLYQQGRTWSFSATTTALLANAFAGGLAQGGELATLKHFPGLGYATKNTDTSVVTLTQSRTALAPGLKPYKTGIAQGVPIVMLSNASYTAYNDPANGAGWSHVIATTLLRTDLGFTGVSITDSLNGTASARGIPVQYLAARASRAGTDLLLLTGNEASTRSNFASLVGAAKAGTISLTTLRASYDRILAMKSGG